MPTIKKDLCFLGKILLFARLGYFVVNSKYPHSHREANELNIQTCLLQRHFQKKRLALGIVKSCSKTDHLNSFFPGQAITQGSLAYLGTGLLLLLLIIENFVICLECFQRIHEPLRSFSMTQPACERMYTSWKQSGIKVGTSVKTCQDFLNFSRAWGQAKSWLVNLVIHRYYKLWICVLSLLFSTGSHMQSKVAHKTWLANFHQFQQGSTLYYYFY